MTQRIPIGRTGKPEEIAAVVHFSRVRTVRSLRLSVTTRAGAGYVLTRLSLLER